MNNGTNENTDSDYRLDINYLACHLNYFSNLCTGEKEQEIDQICLDSNYSNFYSANNSNKICTDYQTWSIKKKPVTVMVRALILLCERTLV